jgi:hypothetical protein
VRVFDFVNNPPVPGSWNHQIKRTTNSRVHWNNNN